MALQSQIVSTGDEAMQKKILGMTAVLAMMALSACETVQGAGRDISTAGSVVQQESAQAQAGM
jgi:predicted small secreted protein